ncbi:MAG TPA: hypothetical protein VFV74_05950 [Burkholderiales bacterium]|nr:hypothetical protein [Burkholderiales bacterium]
MKRLLAVAAVTVASTAAAAPFADPTRPPGSLGHDAGEPIEGPRLQSVLIAPDRRVAVISGEQVTIGSSFRGGRVVRITEEEVRIRRAGGEESLKLFAGGGKRPTAKPRRGAK